MVELVYDWCYEFFGVLFLCEFGGVGFIELQVLVYMVECSSFDIVEVLGDVICVYKQFGGGGWFGGLCVGDFVIFCGSFVISYIDLFYWIVFFGVGGFYVWIFKIFVCIILGQSD